MVGSIGLAFRRMDVAASQVCGSFSSPGRYRQDARVLSHVARRKG